MFESIYNTQLLQLGVKLNRLFHRESGKINWSLSLRHSLAAERGGAPARAPAPQALGGERGSAGKSRHQPGSIPACDSPVPRRCEGSKDSTAEPRCSVPRRSPVRAKLFTSLHICVHGCVWVNHLKVKEKTHNNSDEIKFQKGGGEKKIMSTSPWLAKRLWKCLI